jgi:hypothetical protein
MRRGIGVPLRKEVQRFHDRAAAWTVRSLISPTSPRRLGCPTPPAPRRPSAFGSTRPP